MVQANSGAQMLISRVMWDPVFDEESEVAKLVDEVMASPAHDAIMAVIARPHAFGLELEIMTVQQVIEFGTSLYERAVAQGLADPAPLRNPYPNIHRDVVYYMRMDRLVKIGTSSRIRTREAALMPQGVLAVEFGDRALEKRRHSQFALLHSHGEWFELTPELWQHIAEVRSAFEGQAGKTVEEWLAEHGVANRGTCLPENSEVRATIWPS